MAQTYHRYRAGDKPVGGYKLIRKLGEGGFGEVWQASAPGGAEVALKFIDLTGQQGFREFKALRLVKKITHIHLTPLHGFGLKNEDGTLIDESDVTWSQLAPSMPADPSSPPAGALATAVFAHPVELIVAMGLGRKSLYDRLRECKDEGQAGIPVEELLGYMEDAAKGIDYLNRPIHDMGQGPMPIVHSDIKPHNILIVGDGAQVCDFGLAHAVEALRKTCQAPLTLAYAAPESFRGKPCDKSDQYSLAISYVEMRTGALPFDENMTGFEVMSAHVQGQLDYSRLTPSEQSVIRKASAPLPEDRWRSCREMVIELRKALRLTDVGSDYVPDMRTTPSDSAGTDYRGTIAPPTFLKGDTSPFSGQTPTDRDPLLRTLTPAATTSTVVSAPTERPPIKRRPMPTAAKLFLSLLVLGAVGGAAAYFALNPPGGGSSNNNNGRNDKPVLVDKGSGTSEEDPAEKERRIAEQQKEEERQQELARNAPKQAFAELMKTAQFPKARDLLKQDLLKTSKVFTDAEMAANLRQLQNSWRLHADQAFLEGHYATAASDYADLASEFSNTLPPPDLSLMQARAHLGAGNLDDARKAMAGLTPPAARQHPRDRAFFLSRLLLADHTKSPTTIGELHTIWQEHPAGGDSGTVAASETDLWKARQFEMDKLEDATSAIVSNWIKSAEARRSSADQAGLKTLLDEATKIVQIDDKNVDALVVKGNLHLALGQWAEVGATVKRRLSLRKAPLLVSLRDGARVQEVCYQLTDSATDQKTLTSALASVPDLMRNKQAQAMLAGSVNSLVERSDTYLAAAVQALRSAAESPDAVMELPPLFALLLAKDIRRRLVEEPDFDFKADQFRRDCEYVVKHGGSPDEVVRACHAEALFQLNQPGALQALGAPGNSPYYHYVKARVLSRTPDSAADVRNALTALFSKPITPELKQANRVQHAVEALAHLLGPSPTSGDFNIARALEAPSDPSTLDASYDLLRNAYRWAGSDQPLPDTGRAHLAIAAWWHPAKKDEKLARELSARLVSEWKQNRNDEILDPWLVYRLYHTYLTAHRAAADQPTQENSLAVVDRLIELTKKKPKLDDKQVQAFYRNVVAPYEPWAASLRKHLFYAHVADLVNDSPHLDWGFADQSGKKLAVNQKLEQLYSSAIKLSDGKIPEYHLARGRVRLNLKPYSLKDVLEDAAALTRFKPHEVSGLTLAGQGYFYQSRQETTHTKRLRALDDAIRTLGKALAAGNEQTLTNEQKAERLLVLSYVHLERRNFAGWDANAVDEFKKAAEYAEKAREFFESGPQLEHAYSAAGNAYEDMAWYRPPQVTYLKSDVEANYQKAIQSFEFAVRTSPQSVAAHLNLGRCYFKMATDSLRPSAVGKTVRGMVLEAETVLRRATELATAQTHENPQAHYWLGKVLQLKKLDEGTSVEKAKRLLSVEEFHAADDELSKALSLAVKQNLPDSELGLFAIELADNVLLHPDFHRSTSGAAKSKALLTVAARAGELQKLDLPETTGIDLEQDVKVLNARAKLQTGTGVAALGELNAAADDLRASDPDRASGSDTKLMELRFEIFDDLRADQLDRSLAEKWLDDAVWYAKLPPTINRRKTPIKILEAAKAEATKFSGGAAGESLFTAHEPAWLQAAVESSPRDKRLGEWYSRLLELYLTKYKTATDPTKPTVAADAASRLESLITFLDKRGRNGEADQLRAHAKHYRGLTRPTPGGKTPAKAASRTNR